VSGESENEERASGSLALLTDSICCFHRLDEVATDSRATWLRLGRANVHDTHQKLRI